MTNKFLLLVLFSLPFVQVIAQEQKSPEPAFPFLSSFPNVRDFCLSADGREAYFTVQNPLEEEAAIALMRKVQNGWTQPQLVSFTGQYRDLEPFLSGDGLRLYFSSNRPLNDSIKKSKDYDIWYVERKTLSGQWSRPMNLGAPVNTAQDEFYPSLSSNGNIYFTTERADSKGKDDIYFSRWENGHYNQPLSLSNMINTDGYEFNAYVSPDESFIIYTGYNRKDGRGSGDLYINFKNPTGDWGPAQSLGDEVNSKYMDYCPFVDLQTSTLYFTSRRSTVSDRPFKTIGEFQKEATKYDNGFSRLYKVSLKEVLAGKQK